MKQNCEMIIIITFFINNTLSIIILRQ